MNKKILEAYKNYVNLSAKANITKLTDKEELAKETSYKLLQQFSDEKYVSIDYLFHELAIKSPIFDAIFSIPKLPRQNGTALLELSGSQEAMIDTLCDELSEYQYAALYSQLDDFIEMFEDEAIKIHKLDHEDKQKYIVQMALNKDIFWQTLAKYDEAVTQLEKQLEASISMDSQEPQLLNNKIATLELLKSEV